MFQLNVPKKTTAQIQIWTSVLLLIIATCLSFAPIITLQTIKNADAINEMLDEIAPEANLEIPETVDVTAIKIVKSIGVGAKIIKASVKAAKDVVDAAKDAKDATDTITDLENDLTNSEIKSEEDLENLQNSLETLENEAGKVTESQEKVVDTVGTLGKEILAILETPDGRETMLIALSIATTVASSLDNDNTSGAGLLASILTMLITLIALISLLVLTFVIPIKLLVSTLIALFLGLTKLSNPEAVSTKISRMLPEFISLPFVMMLFQCVVPGMTYGKGIVSVSIVAVISAILGLVVSRLRSYDEAAYRYLNIVQGVSIFGVVGFMVFFFNLIKTNILSSFLTGNFATYLSKVGTILSGFIMSSGKTMPKINSAFLVDLLLIMLYMFFALSSVAYLEKCVERLACSSASKKKGVVVKDTAIVEAILLIAIYVLPTCVMNMKHFFDDPLDTASKVGSESLLVLEDAAQKSAFNMVLVGIILMLVAEIALIVLKNVFCRGMNAESMAAIMSGDEAAAETVEATEATETAETETETNEEVEVEAEVEAEEATEEASAEAAEEIAE